MGDEQRPRRWPVLVHGCFAAAFTGAAFLGRATIIDGGTLSLVWPAAGVAVLWFAWARPRGPVALAVATGLMSLSGLVVNLLTGATPALAVVFVVANLVQVAAAVALLGATVAWPGRGAPAPSPLETVRGSVHLVAAAAVASVGGAVLGCLGLAAVLGGGAVDGETLALWWGRNVSGIVAVVALALLLAHRVVPGRPARHRSRPAGGPSSRLELTVLAAVTVAAFVVLFNGTESASFYPLLALTVWAGLRFDPLVVTVHTAAFGVAAVALTLAGVGPFAAVDSLVGRAVDVQLFVAVSMLLGLVLSASVADQRLLLARSVAAEGEARARADLFATVKEKMTDGVVVLDADGTVVSTNSAAQQLLVEVGLGGVGSAAGSRDVVVHRPDGSVLPREDYPSSVAARDGVCPPVDLVVVREGRRPTVLSVTAARLDDVRPFAAGSGVVAVYRDVTAERDQRDELAGFAGMVAHDLRAPLTAARGWVELARMGLGTATDDDVSDWLGHAHQATVRMSDLIDDLLAHASSSGQHLDLTDVDLGGLVLEVASLHGAEDVLEVGSLPAVRADAVMVRQLLTNLVGNALKYVAPGVTPHVVVDAAVAEEGDEVTVRITDNGLGIAPDDREAVFGRFYRAHRERADIAGHGLGLAVCRTIVERHGGRIAVEGAPGGQGSRFTFTLPCALPGALPLPHPTAVGAPVPPATGGRRIPA